MISPAPVHLLGANVRVGAKLTYESKLLTYSIPITKLHPDVERRPRF